MKRPAPFCALIFKMTLAAVFWASASSASDLHSLSEAKPARHRFSMTCKVDSVIDLFSDPMGREKGIRWMKEHRVEKVWLEIFRHGREAETELLKTVRDDFRAAGFEVAGCITPTTAEFRPLLACVGRPEGYDLFERLSVKAASLFDLVILDDFVFTHCECDACCAARGDRTWPDFRRESQRELCRRFVIEPAKRENPNVEIIMKFPCWFDGYCLGGYDVVRESALFDGVWIGTETREPQSDYAGRRPQTQASWIAGWMNAAAGKKCRGVWFDPIDTRPETYVEQARQSILGGARETLLHCYDYLGTDSPGIVLHGTDREMAAGRADADAFRNEMDGLQRLADLIWEKRPLGVSVPKTPDRDDEEDQMFACFVGLLGIPSLPASSVPRRADLGAVLSLQAESFHGLDDAVTSLIDDGKPILITRALAERLPEEIRLRLAVPSESSDVDRAKEGESGPTQNGGDSDRNEAAGKITPLTGNAFLVEDGGDPWNLTRIPQGELDTLRNRFLSPFGAAMSAPSRVSIHLFAAEESSHPDLVALENFNDEPAAIRLRLPAADLSVSDHVDAAPRSADRGHADVPSRRWIKTLSLPDETAAESKTAENGEILVRMAPRSLILLALNNDEP